MFFMFIKQQKVFLQGIICENLFQKAAVPYIAVFFIKKASDEDKGKL